MKSNNVGYSILTLSIILITQLIIRSVGIENISVQVFIALLCIACSISIFGIYKDGKSGFGIRYNTIVTILLVIASISISVMMIIFRYYPALIDKFGKFFLLLSVIVYFALGLFIIIYRIVYEVKRK